MYLSLKEAVIFSLIFFVLGIKGGDTSGLIEEDIKYATYQTAWRIQSNPLLVANLRMCMETGRADYEWAVLYINANNKPMVVPVRVKNLFYVVQNIRQKPKNNFFY